MACCDGEAKCVLGWRAWFDDGAVYDSASHRWAECPDDGVLFRVIYYCDGTRQLQHGVDYYYEAPHHSGETIIGCGGAKEKIETRYPGAIVKRGRWAPDGFYYRVQKAAMESRWNGH